MRTRTSDLTGRTHLAILMVDNRTEELGIVAFVDRKPACGVAFDEPFEGTGEHHAVISGKGRGFTRGIRAQRGDHAVMAVCQRCERLRATLHCFQRGEGGGKPVDQSTGGIEVIRPDEPARIAMMHVFPIVVECFERVGETACSGLWARAAQDRTLQRGNC